MPGSDSAKHPFLGKLTTVVEENVSNEQFGVSELADALNMSRSNLLRKVRKLTNLSVSQLIRQARLQKAKELLEQSAFNVSEVSFQVGFSSTSYFIKCFREYYGVSPGEYGKREDVEVKVEEPAEEETTQTKIFKPDNSEGHHHVKRKKTLVFASVGIGLLLVLSIIIYINMSPWQPATREKSIAVLPFKNDSNDEANVYLINGVMDATLNNLQKIKDLKVISRTSTEKYRNLSKSIPEMGEELNVSYFVEGSGQKNGDQILLNIQLIDAKNDKHLWSKEYKRETADIFELQQEIARNIASEIQAVITPEEKIRIQKKPTDNLVAYDYFLKARDLHYSGVSSKAVESIPLFKKAIEHDNQFALAHAELVRVYYYLDFFQKEKKYAAEVNNHADKAFLLDSKLAESLVAKAMAYMQKKDYESAETYLEKALEYNPNSILAINFLSDIYNNYIPNTTKYLEYALKGIKLEVPGHDSTIASYNYLHLGNAFLQTGFIDEALLNIDKSLAYYPNNYYSHWVKIFVLFAKNKDLNQAKQLLLAELEKDSTKLYLIEEIGKICYFMRDYEDAYNYYKKFIEIRESLQLDLFKNENLRIAFVLNRMGHKDKAEEYVKSFKEYADNDKSIYKHLSLSSYYCYKGNIPKALEHLQMFEKEENFQYWITFAEVDPLMDAIVDHPQYKKSIKNIENKFWANHRKIRVSLESQGLL